MNNRYQNLSIYATRPASFMQLLVLLCWNGLYDHKRKVSLCNEKFHQLDVSEFSRSVIYRNDSHQYNVIFTKSFLT